LAKQYFINRGKDLMDIVDWDYGLGPGFAAKLEVTNFFAPSIGYGEGKETQKGGRQIEHDRRWGLASLGLFAGEGYPDNLRIYVAGVNLSSFIDPADPPGQRWFAVGPKIYLGYVSGGVYINFGEIADFFAGIAGFDIMHDDESGSPTIQEK